MGKKQKNYFFIWLIGLILGIILVIISVFYCVSNPGSPYAHALSRFFGPIAYTEILTISIWFFFGWSVLIMIIRTLIEKKATATKYNTIETLPEIKVPAKVIFKNSTTTSTQEYSAEIGANVVTTVHDVLAVTFETQEGRRLVFPVTQEQYSLYLENDTGILSYKEYDGQLIFINFERQVESI